MPSLRWAETLQMLAPGVAGVVYLQPFPELLGAQSLLFLLALFLHVLFAYTYNDSCDYLLDQANPSKRTDGRARQGTLRTAARILFVAAAGSAALLPWPIWAWLLGYQLVWVGYSAPGVFLKARIPFAHLIHVGAGVSYFILGVLTHDAPLTSHTWLFAAFFGCLYWVGALAGELTDASSDQRSGLRTLGILLGLKTGIRMLLGLQLLALLCLMFSGIRWALGIGLVGLAAYAVMLAQIWHGLWQGELLPVFRRRYRLLFSLLTAGAVLLSVV